MTERTTKAAEIADLLQEAAPFIARRQEVVDNPTGASLSINRLARTVRAQADRIKLLEAEILNQLWVDGLKAERDLLEARVRELEEWRAAPPTDHETLLVLQQGGRIRLAFYHQAKWYAMDGEGPVGVPIGWLPLPRLPEGRP